MIKLQKGPEPQVLTDNAAKWLKDLKCAIASEDKKSISNAKSKYNNKSIKDALKKETHNKCAYCEGVVSDVSYGDIEHIYPKSLDVEQTFNWNNLTYSCEICNTNKSNKDPNLTKILDPYKVDPKDYICFIGPIISGNGTTEGTLTVKYLKLDRAELSESRMEIFKNLIVMLENIKRARTPEERQALIEDFEENELLPSKEFLAMRRDFWKCYDPRV